MLLDVDDPMGENVVSGEEVHRDSTMDNHVSNPADDRGRSVPNRRSSRVNVDKQRAWLAEHGIEVAFTESYHVVAIRRGGDEGSVVMTHGPTTRDALWNMCQELGVAWFL